MHYVLLLSKSGGSLVTIVTQRTLMDIDMAFKTRSKGKKAKTSRSSRTPKDVNAVSFIRQYHVTLQTVKYIRRQVKNLYVFILLPSSGQNVILQLIFEMDVGETSQCNSTIILHQYTVHISMENIKNFLQSTCVVSTILIKTHSQHLHFFSLYKM